MGLVRVVSLVLTCHLLAGVASGLCPSQCRCDDASLAVACSDANLTVVPIFLNPEIKALSVQGNKIQKLEGALGFYGSLERLDFSRNELKHIGKGQFSSQKRLQNLDLSNNFLTSLHSGGTFKGLGALQTLDLSHNVLSTLENGTFTGLTSLVELRLKHNLLTEISPSAFSGLSRLRVLHLEHNRLSTLSPSWLSALSSIRFLYADSNRLESLPADAFRPLQALRVVTLAGNKLDEDGVVGAFGGARTVDTVNLAHNAFTKVPSKELSQIPQLSSLDISANPIQHLDRDSFRDLFLLRSLSASNMSELLSVSGDAFADNLKLQSLNMEGNPSLQPLPWGVFHFNADLRQVSFRFNAWSALSPHQVPLKSVERLDLAGLPLHCNCSVLWLWELYQRGENSTVKLDQVNCASVAASPPEPKEGEVKVKGGEAGDPLAKMAQEQLICQDWSSVLMAVSISVMVTVVLLVLASLAIYRCKQYLARRRSGGSNSSCLHIKDDTMVYKSTLHPAGNQYPSPAMHQYYVGSGEPAYKTVSTGGYSPTSSSQEPFYEVPKYGQRYDNVAQKSPTHSSGGEMTKAKTRTESNKSSSDASSSGYIAGGEMWESSDLFASPAHGYLNPSASTVNRGSSAVSRSAANNSGAFGSPQSTSTGLSSTGSSSNASSTSSSNSNRMGRPTFYSPATMREPGGRGHHPTQWRHNNAANFSPQLSPPSPAHNNSGSRTLLLHQFTESPSPQQHLFRNNANGGKQFRGPQQSVETGSLMRGATRSNNGASTSRGRNFFV